MSDCPHHEAIIVRVTALEEDVKEHKNIQSAILDELRGIKGFIAQGRTALYVVGAAIGAYQTGLVKAVTTFLIPLLKP